MRVDRGLLVLAAQTWAITGIGVLAGLLLWHVTHEAPAPQVGQRAPLFSLQRLSGDGTVSLASLRGKVVVLNFFASYCDPCKREAPALEKVWRDYRSRGVVVLGIDTDDNSNDARTFVSAHGVTYPAVGGASVGLAARYGTANLPTTYVLNRDGRVVGGEILGPVSDQPFADDLSRYIHAALKS